MSAHTTWQSVHPPKIIYRVQWDHVEAIREGKPDVRRMRLFCDEVCLDWELKHLERRKVKYTVTKYTASIEQLRS